MNLLSYFIEANVILIVGYGLYHLLLRNTGQFTFNRFYLLSIGMLALVIPLFDFPISVGAEYVNTSNYLPTISKNWDQNTLLTPQDNNSTHLSLMGWIASGYAIIAILLLLNHVIKTVRFLNQVKAHKTSITKKNGYNIIRFSDEISPFSFFKNIYLSSSFNPADQKGKLILAHELVHVKQLHSIDVCFSHLINSLFWLNPLAQKIKHAISDNHEYLADQQTLEQDDHQVYKQLLAERALGMSHFGLASFFAKPTILNRLTMMKKKTPRNFGWKNYLAIFLMFSIIVVVACQTDESMKSVENTMQKVIEIPMDDSQSTTDEDVVEASIDPEKIFTIVEDQAVPKAGISEYYNEISKYLDGKYPERAEQMGIEGVVYVQFVIETNGELSDVKVVKGIGGGCDELAAKAVANTSGDWISGKQRGIKVRSQRVIPIRFVLK